MAKSGKQKAAELRSRKTLRLARRAVQAREDRLRHATAATVPADGAPCNPASLAPDNSYSTPVFAQRGYYRDTTFQCRDCGVAEVWTATQQKWWYEIAKGGVWTTATRCRSCRRKLREAASKQREASDAGRERKARLKAAGKWRTGL